MKPVISVSQNGNFALEKKVERKRNLKRLGEEIFDRPNESKGGR